MFFDKQNNNNKIPKEIMISHIRIIVFTYLFASSKIHYLG